MGVKIRSNGGNASVTINGVAYTGTDIEIRNGNVFVDGRSETPLLHGSISVVVNGDVTFVHTVNADVSVSGNCREVKTVSGDVNVQGSIEGSINTVSGDISRK